MKNWLIVLLIFFSFSCQKVEKVERPANLLPEEKMVAVLTDLSLLMSAKNFNRRMLEETGFQPKEFLYQKHNIDSLALVQSTKYYAHDPAQLERIYTKVKRNLESYKADLEVIRAEEIRVQDSINSVEREGDSLRVNKDILELNTDTLLPDPPTRRDTLITSPRTIRNRNP